MVAYVLCTLFTTPQCSWIIDSRAAHHMIDMSSLFIFYYICSRKDKVCIADGSLSSITGQGDILITPDLCLSSILHVPKFSLNLLSISHLTKTLNCDVTFFPSYDVF